MIRLVSHLVNPALETDCGRCYIRLEGGELKRHLGVGFALALAWMLPVASSNAATADRLLHKYQPVTYFTPGEAFRPTTVETFVQDSTLERFVPALGTWVPIDPAPTVDTLPASGAGWRLNQRICSPTAGSAGAACYAAAWSVHPADGTVYGRVARLETRIVLQYWFFYYDDFYPYNPLAPDFIWQAHEGDWEVVNVVLSREDEEPLFVGYSQHCRGETRAWHATPRWRGHHPLVFVALGSHANYFAPGEYVFDQACLPAPILAFFNQAGLPLPRDHVGRGAAAGPENLGAEATGVVPVTETSPHWMVFPGNWGELEYVHAPNPVGTQVLGQSPPGPALHAVWVDPLGTLATWPAG